LGNVTVNASDELDANVSGTGTIWYIGSPKLERAFPALAPSNRNPPINAWRIAVAPRHVNSAPSRFNGCIIGGLCHVAKVAALSSLLLLAACNWSECGDCMTTGGEGTKIEGSGAMKTEVRPVEPFTSIVLTDVESSLLVIERTGEESLTVTAEENLLPMFTSEIKDGVLYLTFKKGSSFHGKRPTYKVPSRTCATSTSRAGSRSRPASSRARSCRSWSRALPAATCRVASMISRSRSKVPACSVQGSSRPSALKCPCKAPAR